MSAVAASAPAVLAGLFVGCTATPLGSAVVNAGDASSGAETADANVPLAVDAGASDGAAVEAGGGDTSARDADAAATEIPSDASSTEATAPASDATSPTDTPPSICGAPWYGDFITPEESDASIAPAAVGGPIESGTYVATSWLVYGSDPLNPLDSGGCLIPSMAETFTFAAVDGSSGRFSVSYASPDSLSYFESGSYTASGNVLTMSEDCSCTWGTDNPSQVTPTFGCALAPGSTGLSLYSASGAQFALINGSPGGGCGLTARAFTRLDQPDAADGGASGAGGDSGSGDDRTPPDSTQPGSLLLFGGVDPADTDLRDTWTWNGSTWSSASAGPSPRAYAAAAGLSGGVVMFGGAHDDGYSVNETWIWNGGSWVEASTPDALTPRYGAAMARLGTGIVLFGGTATGEWPADTWLWDGAKWNPLFVDRPPQRAGHAMAALGDVIVLFGGSFGDYPYESALDDTWTWDGFHWNELPVAGPSARCGHAMTTFGDGILLYGGSSQCNMEGGKDNWASSDNGNCLDDTWRWDGTAWTLLSTNGPASGCSVAMASVDGRLFLFDEESTWVWDGASWNDTGASGPSARTAMVMASY